jgi:peptide chain release factor 1
MNRNNNNDRSNDDKVIKLLEDVEELYLKRKEGLLFNSKNKTKFDNKLKSLHVIKVSRDSLIDKINDYRSLLLEVNDNNEKEILQSELKLLIHEAQSLIEKAGEIVSKDENYENNCMVEIRPGAGGIEAGLFARDLYEMYCRFSDKKGWKLEIVESKADSTGNFTFISFLIKGKNSFQLLKNESGIHRVQRIPATESKGRLQTSTVSVVVLPEINDIEVNISNQDLRIDKYRSSGSGGQHVNTTDSAIRITHIPTGIVATSQDGRSQHDNKDKAMFVLKSRLFEKYKNKQEGEIGAIRSSAIGNSERSEKIRTYNFPQNRLTDHRINFNLNKLNMVIGGNLDILCEGLMKFEAEKQLKSFIERLSKR